MAKRVFYQGKWYTWDGEQMLPAGDSGVAPMQNPQVQPKAMEAETSGATGFKTDPGMNSKDRMLVEQLMKKQGVPQVGTPGEETGAGSESSAKVARATSEVGGFPMPTTIPNTASQIKELAKVGAAAIPATVGAGLAGMGARALLSKPGIISNILGRLAMGAGGAAGEYGAQEAGLSEGGAPSTVLSGLLSMIPGAGLAKRPTADPIQKLVSGANLADKAKKARGEFQVLDKAVRSGKDVDTSKILQPIDDLLMKIETAPASADREYNQIVANLNHIRDTMGSRWGIKLERVKGKPGTPGVPKTDPIYDAMDVTPDSPIKLNTPNRKQIGGEQGSAGTPGEKDKLKMSFSKEPVMANPENFVDDLAELRRLGERADKINTRLGSDIRDAYRAMGKSMPGYSERQAAYATTKGMEKVAATTRAGGNPAGTVRNILDDPVAGGRFNDAQKQAILKEVDRASGISPIVSKMLQSKIGRELLRAGIRPDGQVVRNLFNFALQTGGKYAASDGE